MNKTLWLLLAIAIGGGLFYLAGRSGGFMDESDPRHQSGDDGIVLLYADWCGYCRKLQADFQRAGVRYTTLNVDTREGDRAMQALRVRGVPVTVIGQNVVHGYAPERLQTHLTPLGYQVY